MIESRVTLVKAAILYALGPTDGARLEPIAESIARHVLRVLGGDRLSQIEAAMAAEHSMGHLMMGEFCPICQLSPKSGMVERNAALDILYTRIEHFDLPKRFVKWLKEYDEDAYADRAIYLGDLVRREKEWFYKIPNVGRKTAKEVLSRLEVAGLRLGMDTSGWQRPPPVRSR